MSIANLELTAGRFSDGQSPFLSAHRVSKVLGINQSELAKLIGIARNTLTAKSGVRKVDQALSPVVRILAMVTEMAGDESRAVIWFKQFRAGLARRPMTWSATARRTKSWPIWRRCAPASMRKADAASISANLWFLGKGPGQLKFI